MRNNHIIGIMLRPCSTTLEENKEVVMSAESSVDVDFLRVYNSHLANMQIVAECAKVFIEENYKKVDDWSDIEISIRHREGVVEFYKYEEDTKWDEGVGKIFNDMNKKRHNPMGQIKNIVLDPTDGDLSINMENGEEYWWVDDETAIILADYIEEKLN